MEELGANKGDALLLIDCVTSLGGLPMDLDAWGVDAAYSGTQKCLGVAPGLSPLTLSDTARERIKPVPQSWYLDLNMIAAYVGSDGGARAYHHTAPISMIFSLHAGLGAVLDEGVDQVIARHAACGEAIQTGVQKLGLELFAAEGHRLPQLTSVWVPEDRLPRQCYRSRGSLSAPKSIWDRDRRGSRTRRWQGLAYRLHGQTPLVSETLSYCSARSAKFSIDQRSNMARVAIIGAGPSGLAMLRAFASERDNGGDIPDLVCYERQSDWGGLWNYSWRTGLDDHGEPVHNSMYRYLWSNGPKECLEFADYSFEEHFGKPIASYPPRAVLWDYIKGRVEKSDVRKYIRFENSVRHVTFDEGTGQFQLVAHDHASDTVTTDTFDNVVVASGHFSVPNMPHFPGYDTFGGRILHAHDFRDALEFAGKDIMLIGSSYSAEDIGSQCWKYGAKSIITSSRAGTMGFNWPDNWTEKPILTHVDGNTVHFTDGTSAEVEAIISCNRLQAPLPLPRGRPSTDHRESVVDPTGSTRESHGSAIRNSTTSGCKTSTTHSTCSTPRPGSHET